MKGGVVFGLESMKEEAAYGQTLKQSQLKGLQVKIGLQWLTWLWLLPFLARPHQLLGNAEH